MRNNLYLYIFFLAFLAGCGYTFSGSKSLLDGKYKKIYVEVGPNLTPFSELEDIIASALKDKILSYSSLALVDKKELADAYLSVDLINFERSFGGIGKTGTFDIDEYQVLTYEVKLQDQFGFVVWSSGERKAYSFSSLSIAAVDEAGFDLLEKGFKTKDFRSHRDVHNIDTSASFYSFAEEVANFVDDQVLMPDF
jgi:hypothetical protein